MIDFRPWKEELEFPLFRFVWAISALLLFPSLLCCAGLPETSIPLASTLAALPVCVGSTGQLGIKPLKAGDFGLILLFYGVIILLTSVTTPVWQMLLDKLQITYSEKQDDILELLSSRSIRSRLLVYMSVCVITPVVEEVIFRRIVYSYFVRVNQFAGILITSLLFSLAHFFIYGIPGLFIMGLAFQLIYLLRQNLLTAMILHGLVNTMVFLVHYFTQL